MKICIVSDSHDHREHLAKAVRVASEEGAEAVLHCGDIVAPSTLHAAQPFGLPLHVIHGNNMGDTFHLYKLASDPKNKVYYYGGDASLELYRKKIYINHYPHIAKAMALTGDYDLVCNGHEHQARIETIENIKGKKTVWLNPGTVAGVSAPATFVIGNLEDMTFEIREVPEK